MLRWLSNVLLGLGALLLVYAALWPLGLAPGSRLTLPAPVALHQAPAPPATPTAAASTAAIVQRAPISAPATDAAGQPDSPDSAPGDRAGVSAAVQEPARNAPRPAPGPDAPPAAGSSAATPPQAPTSLPAGSQAQAAPGTEASPVARTAEGQTGQPPQLPTSPGLASPPSPTSEVPEARPSLPVPPVPLVAPDAADRAAEAAYPAPGYAVRLAIPAIKLDTPVQQAGIVLDPDGQPVWQTLPFVAVHYGDLTALVGAPGNAVLAGHVVTLSEGNVFRFLYQVDLGDEIQVWDQRDQLHVFSVDDVKLVPPTDVSVMQPTPEPTLTLITCGGTFDPVRREFSDRLIVTARRVPR